MPTEGQTAAGAAPTKVLNPNEYADLVVSTHQALLEHFIKNITKRLRDDTADIRANPDTGLFSISRPEHYRRALKQILQELIHYENLGQLQTELTGKRAELQSKKTESDAFTSANVGSSPSRERTAKQASLATDYDKIKGRIEQLEEAIKNLQSPSWWLQQLSDAQQIGRPSTTVSEHINGVLKHLLGEARKRDDHIAEEAKKMQEHAALQASASAAAGPSQAEVDRAAAAERARETNGAAAESLQFDDAATFHGGASIAGTSVAGDLPERYIPSSAADRTFMTDTGGWCQERIELLLAVNEYAKSTLGNANPCLDELPEPLQTYYQQVVFELRPLAEIIDDILLFAQHNQGDETIALTKAITPLRKSAYAEHDNKKLFKPTYKRFYSADNTVTAARAAIKAQLPDAHDKLTRIYNMWLNCYQAGKPQMSLLLRLDLGKGDANLGKHSKIRKGFYMNREDQVKKAIESADELRASITRATARPGRR
ncbi:MAG: hypothetical protein K0U29_00640 [Gammaproteobacteria bacterium]|nr:hypothetical protein [Gammaproteobacteria bacterium]MCH9743413.1 hypothetical protein [Gammaproteobacteria bacterium]